MPRRSIEDEPGNHTCENCGEHQASMWWIGEGGTLAVSRFYMQAAWCNCCVLRAQITHAEERMAELEKLRSELAENVCVIKEAGRDA